MRIAMAEGGDLLAGRMRGLVAWDRIGPQLTQLPSGTIVEFDFSGVQLVTGSYLNAGIVPAWPISVTYGLFPVLARVADHLREDIAITLRDQKLTAWVSAAEPGTSVDLVGLDLDPSLRAIVERTLSGPVSATMLHAESEEGVGRTAWSNRLALLEQYRLLRSYKSGRQLYYIRPWDEVEHG